MGLVYPDDIRERKGLVDGQGAQNLPVLVQAVAEGRREVARRSAAGVFIQDSP